MTRHYGAEATNALLCLAAGVPGRLIPLPREISAGCGLAWRMLPEEFEQWQHRLDAAGYDRAAAVEQ